MKKTKARFWYVIFMLGTLLSVCSFKLQAAAADTDDPVESGESDQRQEVDVSLLDEVDFGELDEFLTENRVTEKFDFKELVRQFIAGEDMDKSWLFTMVKDAFLREINERLSCEEKLFLR